MNKLISPAKISIIRAKLVRSMYEKPNKIKDGKAHPKLKK